MDRLSKPSGYVVRDGDAVKRILETEAELLRSEGLDPAWPGFPAERGDESGGDSSDRS